jgi:hypothetical protein
MKRQSIWKNRLIIDRPLLSNELPRTVFRLVPGRGRFDPDNGGFELSPESRRKTGPRTEVNHPERALRDESSKNSAHGNNNRKMIERLVG